MNLKNEKVLIIYHPKTENNPRPYFYIRDLTDTYNETSAYTKKVRKIEQARLFIEQIFTDDNNPQIKDNLNFWNIVNLLDTRFNLDTHTYCAVD